MEWTFSPEPTLPPQPSLYFNLTPILSPYLTPNLLPQPAQLNQPHHPQQPNSLSHSNVSLFKLSLQEPQPIRGCRSFTISWQEIKVKKKYLWNQLFRHTWLLHMQLFTSREVSAQSQGASWLHVQQKLSFRRTCRRGRESQKFRATFLPSTNPRELPSVGEAFQRWGGNSLEMASKPPRCYFPSRGEPEESGRNQAAQTHPKWPDGGLEKTLPIAGSTSLCL